jgi:hypothetical protein
VATQAASSALSHLFMLCPFLGPAHPFGSAGARAKVSKYFGIFSIIFPRYYTPQVRRLPVVSALTSGSFFVGVAMKLPSGCHDQAKSTERGRAEEHGKVFSE